MAPPAYLGMLTQTIRCFPVTSIVVAATLIISLPLINRSGFVDIFLLHSDLANLYPWCVVTYAFAIPGLTLLFVPLHVALYVNWGSVVEAGLGSADFFLYCLFTIVVSAAFTLMVDKILLTPLGRLFNTLYLKRLYWSRLDEGNATVGHYLYWGAWPVAQVIAFGLCRIRDASTPVGPAWDDHRLTLRQIPLTLVLCAAVQDMLVCVLHNFAEPIRYRNGLYYYSDPQGWCCVLALVSLFVAWLYERHVSGTANAAFALDAFFYPAPVRNVVRRAGEATCSFLRSRRLSFLLPPRRSSATMPMPVFAGASAAAGTTDAVLTSNDAAGRAALLLPGTTAEEAERYRLIAREALARRLQEQRQPQAVADTAAAHTEYNTNVAAVTTAGYVPQPSASPLAAEEEASDDKTA